MTRYAAIAVFLLLTCPTNVSAGLPAWATPELIGRLENGEVIVSDSRTSESGGAARLWMFVPGGVEDMRRVILSCARAFEFAHGLRECDRTEEAQGRLEMRQVVKKHWLLPSYEYRFELVTASMESGATRLSFQLLDGDLDVLEGRWLFHPLPGGILADYEIRVKPRLPVPRFLVRRAIKKEMPETLACIRGLALPDDGRWPDREADIERCLGEPRSESSDGNAGGVQ